LKKRMLGFVSVLVFSMLLSVPLVLAVPSDVPRGPPDHLKNGAGYIYVESQELYYRTIVPYAGGNLPHVGNNDVSFQTLDGGGTPVGPGDVGYRGGRWYKDGTTYFLCPLLGHTGIPEIPTA
jgi:hypothetical protein